jgi:DNA modification methylase
VSTIVNERYERVPVDAIRTHPKNPRRGDVDVIATSIAKNGFYGAVVVQRSTGYILAGNHRFLAAKKAGLTEVPVLFVDVDDKTARRILLADNRTSDIATYDDGALAALLKELRAEQDLLGSGYDDSDVDKLLKELGAKTSEPDVVDETSAAAEDESVDELPAEPDSKPGEVYELGPHRLICGDATCVTDIEKLLRGETVDLLWTDPPYNVGYEEKTKRAINQRKRPLPITNDALNDTDFLEFLTEAFSTASTAMRAGAGFYIAHADTQGLAFRMAVRKVGWKLSQCLIWVKDRFVLSRTDYHWKHEPILYGWKEGAAHHAVEDRTQDTIWEFARPGRSDEHPTMKPIALVERAIRNSTRPGGVVLDLFGGSGTTLLAAARAGRVARLVEIDPRYCDVIRRRWERHVAQSENKAA